MWVADDQGAEVLRVSPRSNKVIVPNAGGRWARRRGASVAGPRVGRQPPRQGAEPDQPRIRTEQRKLWYVLPGDAPERMVSSRRKPVDHGAGDATC